MDYSALHQLIADYLERDDCLYFALGLAKATAGFQRWLEKAAPFEEMRIRPENGKAQGDPYVFFLLGLLSFSRNFSQLIADLPDRQKPNEQRLNSSSLSEPEQLPQIRELLR